MIREQLTALGITEADVELYTKFVVNTYYKDGVNFEYQKFSEDMEALQGKFDPKLGYITGNLSVKEVIRDRQEKEAAENQYIVLDEEASTPLEVRVTRLYNAYIAHGGDVNKHDTEIAGILGINKNDQKSLEIIKKIKQQEHEALKLVEDLQHNKEKSKESKHGLFYNIYTGISRSISNAKSYLWASKVDGKEQNSQLKR